MQQVTLCLGIDTPYTQLVMPNPTQSSTAYIPQNRVIYFSPQRAYFVEPPFPKHQILALNSTKVEVMGFAPVFVSFERKLIALHDFVVKAGNFVHRLTPNIRCQAARHQNKTDVKRKHRGN